tara:strand:- start:208 stop:468 length:261 start_codon:yes stop_codon:yes gene_type:complete
MKVDKISPVEASPMDLAIAKNLLGEEFSYVYEDYYFKFVYPDEAKWVSFSGWFPDTQKTLAEVKMNYPHYHGVVSDLEGLALRRTF